jgi:hypothetical protein
MEPLAVEHYLLSLPKASVALARQIGMTFTPIITKRKIVPCADGQVPVLSRFLRRRTRRAHAAIADDKIFMLRSFMACKESQMSKD